MALKIPPDESYDLTVFNKNMKKFAKLNGIDMSSSTKAEGDAFELFVATVFKFNGFKIDKIVGGSGDQGGDILVHKGSKTTKTVFTVGTWYKETEQVNTRKDYCIQCKYHSKGKEGNKAGKDAALGKKKYKCDYGVAVTSTDFTSDGLEAAKLQRISTINGKQLTTMILKASKKQDPWAYKWPSEELSKVKSS